MTGVALKLIAVAAMLIDHMGHVLFPGQFWMRYIGRLAFPIFCFLLVEGFIHTRNLQAYMIRLLISALVSEVPFDLALYGKIFTIEHQNVFWTLLFGLMAVSVMSMVNFENIYIRILIQAASAVPFGVAAQLLHTDYRWIGVGLISGFYIFHDAEILKVASGAFFMLPFFTNEIEYAGVAAFIPLHFYNGRSGVPQGSRGRFIKIAFYLFYPLHLLTLAVIRDMAWM